MTKIKPIAFLTFIVVVFFSSCKEDNPKFERPEWLAGKLYSQIIEIPELSTFAKCVELTGYDKILDVSGSYTVFAPSNDAFAAFFNSHPQYNSVEDIPITELNKIVKYHIVQNPWTKKQLRALDVFGWIDTMDVRNNLPRGFKRETLLLNDNQKYGVSRNRNNGPTITDTLSSNWHRRVATDSRKHVPIFFSEYFNIYKLTSDDYQFYFDRPFEGGNSLHFANAKIASEEIFAENGFVYVIDRVVMPLRNAYQILDDRSSSNSYAQFRNLINEFSSLRFNLQKTNQQPGVELGLQVDSLFDLMFPDLIFDIANERTSPPSGTYGLPANVTIRYHHGMIAPTDEAFERFIKEYIQIPGGWGTLAGAPQHIRKIIANTHLSQTSLYPSDFADGFINGEFDIVDVPAGDIVQKEFGSNSSFIGINNAIVPRAFSSVTGPIYLRQGFSKIMYAIEETGLLPTLKRKNKNYMFFVESDFNTSIDSSFIYSPMTNRFSVISRGIEGNYTEFRLSRTSLRNFLLNHITDVQPEGLARKEFIPNLAGSYITFNNVTGEVRGTAPTTEGYLGNLEMPEFPVVLSNADNGVTYEIQNWLSFTGVSLYSQISTNFPKFHALLQKAGLSLDKQSKYSFISDSEYYTVFVPSDEAIDEANLNAVPVAQLKNILQLHFVQGEMVFTDGKKTAKQYETTRVDEKSTPFSTVFTRIYLEPGLDQIKVKDKNNMDYALVEESDKTNILASIILETVGGEMEEVFPNIINTAVIHQINRVLLPSETGN